MTNPKQAGNSSPPATHRNQKSTQVTYPQLHLFNSNDQGGLISVLALELAIVVLLAGGVAFVSQKKQSLRDIPIFDKLNYEGYLIALLMSPLYSIILILFLRAFKQNLNLVWTAAAIAVCYLFVAAFLIFVSTAQSVVILAGIIIAASTVLTIASGFITLGSWQDTVQWITIGLELWLTYFFISHSYFFVTRTGEDFTNKNYEALRAAPDS